MNKIYFPPAMTPAEVIALAARSWRFSDKPLWFIVGAHSGRVLTWAANKSAAKRAVAKRSAGSEPCILARAERPGAAAKP